MQYAHDAAGTPTPAAADRCRAPRTHEAKAGPQAPSPPAQPVSVISLQAGLLGWNFSDQPHRHDRHATRVSPARGQNRCCKGAEASPDLSTAVRSGRKRAVAPRAALSSFCAGAAEAPPVTGGPARWLGRDTELAAAAVTGSCAAAAASAKLWTTMIDCPALHMC